MSYCETCKSKKIPLYEKPCRNCSENESIKANGGWVFFNYEKSNEGERVLNIIMLTKEQLKKIIQDIEDECFEYADDKMLKNETYSFGCGVQKGARIALKHIKPLMGEVEE